MRLLSITLLLLCAYATTAQNTAPADTSKKKYDRLNIHGVIQVHHLTEFNTNGDSIRDPAGFRILRARLIAEGDLNKYVSYQLMIDPRAPEQNGILRDAYIGLHLIKDQTIKVGQQKTQFGWENRQSITELYTVNRAEMSDGASRGENLRDIGVGLIGHIKLNDRLRIEDAITLTNGTKMNVEGPYDFNRKLALWGRVGLRYKKDDLTARLGASFGTGGLRYLGDTLESVTDDIYADFTRYGADVQIDHKYFFLAAEYAAGTDMVNDTISEEPMGYQAIIALKTKWHIGPLARYDVFEDEWEVFTVGAYYGEPKDRLRVLVNYLFRGGVIDIPNGHDDRLYVQMQLTF